jgi:hypothetical protein
MVTIFFMLSVCCTAKADELGGTVHWNRVKGEISPDLFSMNLFSFPNREKVANPRYRENLRYMKPAILRLHNAGIVRESGGARLVDVSKKDWDYEKIKTILHHLKDVPGERIFNIVDFPPWMETNDDKMLSDIS